MNNIYQSLTAIMNEVEAIGKTKKNAQQGFMYRGIDDLYNDLQPKFAKYKVFIASEVLEILREERQTKSGGSLIYTILKVKFTFYAEDGSWVSSIMVGEAMDSGDKGSNKAMSTALKYCLFQLLLIPTEEVKESDPDATAHQVQPKSMQVNGTAKQESKSESKADDNKPWLNKDSKEFKACAARLTAGTATIKVLRDHFKISKEVAELLEGYIPSNLNN